MQFLLRQLERERDRWFLWSPVLIAIGSGGYFLLRSEPEWWAAVPLALAGLVLTILLRRQSLNAGVLLLLLVAGFIAGQVETWRYKSPMLRRDLGFVDFSGRVKLLEMLPDGRRITFNELRIAKLPPERTPVAIRLIERKAAGSLQIGDQVSGKAFLRAIPEPVLPGDYDFRRNAYFTSLGATGFLAGPLAVTETSKQWLTFDSARARLEAKISQQLTSDSAAISSALLTGDQEGISQQTLQEMRLSGLTHILSVSGLHIGLAAALLFFLIRGGLAAIPAVALRYPIKKWAAVGAIGGATAYTMFAGAPVPAVRSLLMAGIALFAVIIDRDALSLRTVALSAVLIILIVPDALTGPSFQLSYAAIVGIIAAHEASEPWRTRLEKPQNLILRGLFYIGAIAVSSLIASLATAPFTHYHFQQLSFYGVISNMLAIPLTSFWLMPAALLAMALVPFGLSAYPLLVLGKGVELLMAIAANTAQLPGADWAPPNLPFPALLLIVTGMLWLVLWTQGWRFWGFAPLIAGLIWMCFPAKPLALVAGDGRFTALQTASGYTLVSDTGRRHVDGFMPDEWRKWLGVRTYEDASGLCDELSCHADTIDFVRDGNLLSQLCGVGAAIVIYPAGRLHHCGQVDIDEPYLWRSGTIALYDDGTIDRVANHVGDRPWSIRQTRPYAKSQE